MGRWLDAPQDAADVPAAPPGYGDDFGAAFKRGIRGISGGAHRVAGTVMDAAGFDGSDQNAAAARDKALAGASAPSVDALKDIHSIRDAGHYAAGFAGGIAPVLAAGAVGGIPGAAAAMAPQMAGEEIERLQANPNNAFASPGSILSSALPMAALKTATLSAVPGGAAGRLFAGGLRGAAGRIAGEGAMQGAAGAVGEGISQVDENLHDSTKGYNGAAIREAGMDNAGAGLAFGTAHAVGHVFKGAPGRAYDAAKGYAGDAVDAAKGLVPDRVKQALGSAKTAVGDAAETAKDRIVDADIPGKAGDLYDSASAAVKAADIPGKLSDIYDAGKTKGKAFLDKMASGAETAEGLGDHVDNPKKAGVGCGAAEGQADPRAAPAGCRRRQGSHQPRQPDGGGDGQESQGARRGHADQARCVHGCGHGGC